MKSEFFDSMESFDEITVEIHETETGLYFPVFNENEKEFFPSWLVNFLGPYDRLTAYLYKYGFRW